MGSQAGPVVAGSSRAEPGEGTAMSLRSPRKATTPRNAVHLVVAMGLALTGSVAVTFACGTSAASTVATSTTTSGRAGSARDSAAIATPLPPNQDPFYSYSGSTPLADIAPGTVLNQRSVQVALGTTSTPITAEQLL